MAGWQDFVLEKVDFLRHEVLGEGRLGMTSVPGPDGARRVPDALERDVRAFAELGVARIVCLLPGEELGALGAGALQALCEAEGIGFSHLAIVDGRAPSDGAAFRHMVRGVLDELQAGRTVVAHCRAGFGRTGTFAACCLVAGGLEPDEAIAAVRALRVYAVETAAQEAFVRSFSA